MEYTKKECVKWSKNRSLEPRTNRPIEIGSDVYIILSDSCEKYGVIISYRLSNKSYNVPSTNFNGHQSSGKSCKYSIINNKVVKNYNTSQSKVNNKNKGVIHTLNL